MTVCYNILKLLFNKEVAMAQRFSERYGYVETAKIQIEFIDESLKNRIWNLFYCFEYDAPIYKFSDIEYLMDKLGMQYEHPVNYSRSHQDNLNKLKYNLFNREWNYIYDFLEAYISILNKEKCLTIITAYNKILEEEKSGYRIIKGLVTPITNEQEMQSIENANKTKYDTVNIHMRKALEHYSDRKNPDYENSIKESISAVEALCCIITENNKATLGEAIKKIEEKLPLHGSLKDAISKLYGYTSDENGIRHAGIDFKGASSEDAKYMLVICSAFVNYIIEKWEK